MAIDSECKRRSALARLVTPHPVVDGSISASDRAHALWHYCGIVIAASSGWTPTAVARRQEDLRLARTVQK